MYLHQSRCLLLAATLFAAGCASSTPQSRISRNHQAFESFPSEVQRKISAGVVDVGFTPQMVRMALGEPAREFSRRTENGTTEVWVYNDKSPRVSVGFGVGFGSYGRHSASSVGVSTSTGSGYDRDERMRVEFRDGYVSEVEYRKR
ncbi:MAG TPA: hypothetical protein VG734_16080 [Lacunisphaera sp.]|nr:hypothetical protein [Lacunisphaera sp.]